MNKMKEGLDLNEIKVEREFLGKYTTEEFIKKIIKSHINHHNLSNGAA